MPNWCTNYLIVTGQETEVEKFMNQIPLDKDGNGENLFQKFVPIGDYDRETAIEKWGTKWDVDEIDMSSWEHKDGRHDDGTYSWFANLQTAWAPPVEAITAISVSFPELDFGMTWHEEGIGFYGYAFMNNGELCDIVEGELPDFYQLAEEKLDPRNSPYLGDEDVAQEASEMEYNFIDNIEDQLSEVMSNKRITA